MADSGNRRSSSRVNLMEINQLIDAAKSGDARALGRLCSIIERGGATSRILTAKLYPFGGKGWTTGITR